MQMFLMSPSYNSCNEIAEDDSPVHTHFPGYKKMMISSFQKTILNKRRIGN